MTGAATGAVGVKGRGGADGLPHRLHLLQDVQDRLFGLRKVVELDSHSSPAVLSLSAVADLAHHLEGDGRPGGCLNLDKNPAADEIAFGARKKSRVLKKFKASAENGNVQDLASAPHPRWATLDRVLAVPLSLLARKASPFCLHSPPVVSLQASFHRLTHHRGDAFAVPTYRKTNSRSEERRVANHPRQR